MNATDQNSAELPEPRDRVRDAIWLIVVVSFAVVLVGAFVTIAADGSKPDIVLTMFTSAVGFLAGLFVPSPVGDRK